MTQNKILIFPFMRTLMHHINSFRTEFKKFSAKITIINGKLGFLMKHLSGSHFPAGHLALSIDFFLAYALHLPTKLNGVHSCCQIYSNLKAKICEGIKSVFIFDFSMRWKYWTNFPLWLTLSAKVFHLSSSSRIFGATWSVFRNSIDGSSSSVTVHYWYQFRFQPTEHFMFNYSTSVDFWRQTQYLAVILLTNFWDAENLSYCCKKWAQKWINLRNKHWHLFMCHLILLSIICNIFHSK